MLTANNYISWHRNGNDELVVTVVRKNGHTETLTLPAWVKMAPMSKLDIMVFGKGTPAVTYNRTIHINMTGFPVVRKLITGETVETGETIPVLAYVDDLVRLIIHEFGHCVQEREMGRLHYVPTYVYHGILGKFKGADSRGGCFVHADHMMERQTERVAVFLTATFPSGSNYYVEQAVLREFGVSRYKH